MPSVKAVIMTDLAIQDTSFFRSLECGGIVWAKSARTCLTGASSSMLLEYRLDWLNSDWTGLGGTWSWLVLAWAAPSWFSVTEQGGFLCLRRT